jgi:hypothetical protein
VTTGSRNVIIGAYTGNSGGLDIRTANNYIALSDGDGNLLISTNSTRSVALNGAIPQTGTGITFPASPNLSTNANTLDAYEEGTWTPVLNFGGAAGVSVYNYQNGTYTKVGNVVTVRCYIAINTKTAATGAATLSGLPYAFKTSTAAYASAYMYISNGGSITNALMAYASPTTAIFNLGQGNGSTGFNALQDGNFTNGDFILQSTYLTD